MRKTAKVNHQPVFASRSLSRKPFRPFLHAPRHLGRLRSEMLEPKRARLTERLYQVAALCAIAPVGRVIQPPRLAVRVKQPGNGARAVA